MLDGGKLYRCNISGQMIFENSVCLHPAGEVFNLHQPHFNEFTLAEYLGVVDPPPPAPDPELVRQYIEHLAPFTDNWAPFRHALLAAKAWLKAEDERCLWTFRGERCFMPAWHGNVKHETRHFMFGSRDDGASKCST